MTRRLRRPRLTYANVASTLALFMALSGVAWAASLPKNSVGARQIKKNAVRASEIRRNGVSRSEIKRNAVSTSEIKTNAVSSSEIKSNAVKGAEVDENSLGKVPSAAASDTVATDLGPKTALVASSSTAAGDAAARASASAVPLLTVGQITIYGKCFVDSSTGLLHTEVLARTTADGAVAISTSDEYDGDPSFLNAATPEDARRVDWATTLSAGTGGDDRATVIGPDGNGAALHISTWGKHGATPGSSPLVKAGDQCYFAAWGKRIPPPV